MKVSTKGRYGLRAMVELAANNTEEFVSIKVIAHNQQISENYLEQLFSALKKAGLVVSTRGSQGGYKLAKPAESISVGDVLVALEGDLAPVDCVLEKDNARKCNKTDICITKQVWEKVYTAIKDTVNNITLKQLAEEYNFCIKSQQNTDFGLYI